MVCMETKWIYKMIDYTTMELELIFEEVAKLPRTTDTSYVVPDVLELVEQRIWDYD
jgi:hypothetical protein